jgi:2-polyprenyl-3-methyl-5-hydroxy-6-metoxy-1,4-benzoquinol methylase
MKAQMNSYKKLCTEFYDIDKPTVPREAFEFFLRYVRNAKGAILEPMCGSGRFLLPLLELGLNVDGVDASSNMLHACRKNGLRRGLNPSLYEQFLQRLELSRRYDLVIIPAGSFCLITDQFQIQESLRRLHAHMMPGATLVLEIERLLPQMPNDETWDGRWVNRSDGAKIVMSWLSHYEETERVSHSLHRYELIKDGQLLEIEWEEFDLRYYEISEFCALLESAGFKAIQILKAYGNSPPDDTDESVVFECMSG